MPIYDKLISLPELEDYGLTEELMSLISDQGIFKLLITFRRWRQGIEFIS